MTSRMIGKDIAACAQVVYAIQIKDGGPVKIGLTKNLSKRARQLANTHFTSDLFLVTKWPGSLAFEQKIHAHLAPYRVANETYEPCDDVVRFLRLSFQEACQTVSYVPDDLFIAAPELPGVHNERAHCAAPEVLPAEAPAPQKLNEICAFDAGYDDDVDGVPRALQAKWAEIARRYFSAASCGASAASWARDRKRSRQVNVSF